jgi:hypothetical protein
MQPRTPRPYALAVPTDAPSAEAANAVHREAHGLVADDVFEVQEGYDGAHSS